MSAASERVRQRISRNWSFNSSAADLGIAGGMAAKLYAENSHSLVILIDYLTYHSCTPFPERRFREKEPGGGQ
jgi:hypothetical protein